MKLVTYRRTAGSGVSLLAAELWLQEIRIIAAAQCTSTKQPDGADPVHNGTVQATPPPTPNNAVEVGSTSTTTDSVPGFWDTQVTTDPYYTSLGSCYALYFLSNADLASAI